MPEGLEHISFQKVLNLLIVFFYCAVVTCEVSF